MERTYNFQVDNGMFVAEYYLDKEYEDIKEEDLRDSINSLTEKLDDYNMLSTLSSTSHNNSALTQGKKELRKDRIKAQLVLLLDSVGSDKNCMICNKKQVNTDVELPYSSLIYGLASPDAFMNRGNNLRSVDVCPICMFYSMLSFLNTQKISYPFVYLSDSDEFMRDITARNQEQIAENIMLDIKQKDMDQNFIPIISELIGAKEDGVYDDLNYISLIQYANGQSNYYKDTVIEKDTIDFLLRIKDRGLIVEFYDLGLFYYIMRDYDLLRRLARIDKDISIELYDIIKEEVMTKDEIKLIEELSSKLSEEYGAGEVLKDLKTVKDQRSFRQLLIKYTGDIDLGLSLMQIDTLVQRYGIYIDYLRLEIQMANQRRDNNGKQ